MSKTNFETIAAGAQELGRFLRSLPILEAPWDTEFQKRYCSGCAAEDCDVCPNERFRNNPSYDVFEKVIRYFNLSADTVIYPNENLTNTTYQQIERLLTRCDEGQLRVILATTEALLSESEMPSDSE